MKEIDLLVKLHHELYPYEYGDIIRSNTYLDTLNSILDTYGNIDSNDLNEIVKGLIYCCAAILCLQPFYDGNTHTAKSYIVYKLKERGYYLESQDIENDYFIPIIYDISEINISGNRVNNLIKKIKNK